MSDHNTSQRLSSGRSPLEQTLAELADPHIEALGFELVRVRITGGDNMVVQFIAERPDRTMGVDDCATVSRALSDLFDEEDPIHGDYTLEVSSPGIARPLTRAKDFDDFKGHLIKAELIEALDGRKRFRGILDGMEDGHVMIAAEGDRNDAGEEMVWGLPFHDIAEARLVMTDELVASDGPQIQKPEDVTT
jgi:ribosome maturation factor RimP